MAFAPNGDGAARRARGVSAQRGGASGKRQLPLAGRPSMVWAMHVLAVGSWGAFFGTVALMLAGGVAAFVQSHHRVALAAGMTGVLSAVYVASFLHLLPIGDPLLEARTMAAAAIFSASMLRLMFLVDLGKFRKRGHRRRILASAAAIAGSGVLLTWLVDATDALVIGNVVTFALSAWVLADALRSARTGDRIAWLAVVALLCMLVSLAGLGWIAFDPAGVPWPVHTLSAVTAMAYLTAIGAMLWLRYSYLIELREVLANGPRYDPVTRMRSSVGTAHMLAQAFARQQQSRRPLVLIAVSVGNLYSLENLHGRAALNHALFLCAGRLRRCVPPDVEVGRLFDDGFLIVSRNGRDPEELIKLGRAIVERLSRPVVLRTATGEGEEEGRAEWAAQVGVGLLLTPPVDSSAVALGKVRDMSRTAWSYRSRLAWHDQAGDLIAEVPALEAAA
jgi:GGDEF domain-containing protein